MTNRLFIQPGVTHQRNVDAQAFKSACYTVARELSGVVQSFREPGATPNYIVAHLDLRDGPVVVLCNCAIPRVAFTQHESEGVTPIRFIDMPALADAMHRLSFTAIPADALHAPLGTIDTACLEPGELADIRYWRPQTVGELIFNHFD